MYIVEYKKHKYGALCGICGFCNNLSGSADFCLRQKVDILYLTGRFKDLDLARKYSKKVNGRILVQ